MTEEVNPPPQEATVSASDNPAGENDQNIDQEEIPFREGVPYDEFVDMVKQKLSYDEYGATGQLPRLLALKDKLKDSHVWKVKQFQNLTDHFYYFIVNQIEEFTVNEKLRDYINEFRRMDAFFKRQKTMGKMAKKKLISDVRRIHNTMRKYLKKIQQLDKAEIAVDELDDEDNEHHKKIKYEKRFNNQAKKLLELQGVSGSSVRVITTGIRFDGTPYPEINQEVVNSYKLMMTNRYGGRVPSKPMYCTPTYEEYLKLVQKIKQEKGLSIDDEEALARQITEQVAMEVKNRRAAEMLEMLDDYLHDENLMPKENLDFEDPELLDSLKKNDEVNEERYKKLEEDIKLRADKLETNGSDSVPDDPIDLDVSGDEEEEEDDEEEEEDDGAESELDEESTRLDDLSPDNSEADDNENLGNLEQTHNTTKDSPKPDSAGYGNGVSETEIEEEKEKDKDKTKEEVSRVVDVSLNSEQSKNAHSQPCLRRQNEDSPTRNVKKLKTMNHPDVTTSLEIREASSHSTSKDDSKRGPEIHSIEDDDEDFVDSSGNPLCEDGSDDDCIIID